MSENSDLAAIATKLETMAQATTTANATEAGYWKRIAAAAETWAASSSSANANTNGYMKRAAAALEAKAATSNTGSFLYRLTKAMEAFTSSSSVGSLLKRFQVAVAAIPTIGPELVVNGTMDSSTGWTLSSGTTISGGVATCDTTVTAGTVFQSGASGAPAAVVGHRYRCTFTITAVTQAGGGISIQYGGVNGTARSAPGTYQEDLVATTTGRVGIIKRGGTNFAGSFDNISVKEVF